MKNDSIKIGDLVTVNYSINRNSQHNNVEEWYGIVVKTKFNHCLDVYKCYVLGRYKIIYLEEQILTTPSFNKDDKLTIGSFFSDNLIIIKNKNEPK